MLVCEDFFLKRHYPTMHSVQPPVTMPALAVPRARRLSSAAAFPSCPCLRCWNTEWSALDGSRPDAWAWERKDTKCGPQTEPGLTSAVTFSQSRPQPTLLHTPSRDEVSARHPGGQGGTCPPRRGSPRPEGENTRQKEGSRRRPDLTTCWPGVR